MIGLGVPPGRLVLLTTNVPGFGERALMVPMSDTDLIVPVQELYFLSDGVVLVVTLDILSNDVQTYLRQSRADGFALALVDEDCRTGRLVDVHSLLVRSPGVEGAESDCSESNTVSGSGLRYLVAAGRVGHSAASGASVALGYEVAPVDAHFRPVIGAEHAEELKDTSLQDFIRIGSQRGSIRGMVEQCAQLASPPLVESKGRALH